MWKSWGGSRATGLTERCSPEASRDPKVRKSARVPPARSPGSYLPAFPDHDVVAVPVADAQHVGGHTVAGAGEGELLDGPVQGLPVGTTPSHSLQPELRHPVPSSKSTLGLAWTQRLWKGPHTRLIRRHREELQDRMVTPPHLAWTSESPKPLWGSSCGCMRWPRIAGFTP